MNEELYTPLRRIARGYLFIHLNINLGTVDILPDWLGYYWILTGIWAVAAEVETIKLLESFAIGLTAWNGLTWVLKIFGISADWILLNLLLSVVHLYFHFQLLTDLARLAGRYRCPEEEGLLRLRTLYTIVGTLARLPLFFPILEEMAWLVALLVLAGLAAAFGICRSLYALSRSITEWPDTLDVPQYVREIREEPPEPTEDPPAEE